MPTFSTSSSFVKRHTRFRSNSLCRLIGVVSVFASIKLSPLCSILICHVLAARTCTSEGREATSNKSLARITDSCQRFTSRLTAWCNRHRSHRYYLSGYHHCARAHCARCARLGVWVLFDLPLNFTHVSKTLRHNGAILPAGDPCRELFCRSPTGQPRTSTRSCRLTEAKGTQTRW